MAALKRVVPLLRLFGLAAVFTLAPLPATLGADRAPYAWRRWMFPWSPDRPGSYLAMSRATDTRGRTQPIVAAWNPSGYLWNVIDKVRINVGT